MLSCWNSPQIQNTADVTELRGGSGDRGMMSREVCTWKVGGFPEWFQLSRTRLGIKLLLTLKCQTSRDTEKKMKGLDSFFKGPFMSVQQLSTCLSVMVQKIDSLSKDLQKAEQSSLLWILFRSSSPLVRCLLMIFNPVLLNVSWCIGGIIQHFTSYTCLATSGGFCGKTRHTHRWRKELRLCHSSQLSPLTAHRRTLIVPNGRGVGGLHGCAWCISYREAHQGVWVFLKFT